MKALLRASVALASALASFLGLGCATLLGSATESLTDDLSTAILSQDDPELVRQGAPSFLLMLDGLIEGSPENEQLLLVGARLYGAYAGAFVSDEARLARLTARALEYGRRALCLRDADLCAALDAPFEQFEAALARTDADDVPALYGFGGAWAGWLQARSGNWAAVAEVPKLEALMERIVALDDAWDGGGAHLYLGVLYCQRPASLGGKPDAGRRHFERALELSGGRDLMAKVLFADSYARLVFDRPLHDRLLEEVLAADPRAPDWTLSNVLAQEQARTLLDGSDEYF